MFAILASLEAQGAFPHERLSHAGTGEIRQHQSGIGPLQLGERGRPGSATASGRARLGTRHPTGAIQPGARTPPRRPGSRRSDRPGRGPRPIAAQERAAPEAPRVSGYVLSADADFDLDEIWEYIAADNLDAADRWIGKLFDAFEALGQTPGMGHRREDLTPYPVLFWPVGAYLIIYRTDRRPTEIVAVTQGSRDIPAFLSRRIRHRDSA